MSKQQTEPKSSGGSPNQPKKQPLLPKSKWNIVLVNSTAEKILADFLDNGEVEPSKVEMNEKFNKRNVRNFVNVLEDYQDAYKDYNDALVDADKDKYRTELLTVFDDLVSDSQVYYKTHDMIPPFIQNEWRYETLEAQKADLASLETQKHEREEWLKSCPFTLTDRAKSEIMKIDSDHIGRQ